MVFNLSSKVIFYLLLLFMSFCLSSSFIFDVFSKCFITINDTCPNENVTFFLYTRSVSKTSPIQLNMNNITMITEELFEKNAPIIILIHGYTGHKDYSPNSEIRPALLNYGKYNIISVDYQPLALSPCYIQAVQNLPVVAKCTAQLLNYLVMKSICKFNDIHIIGFSLGAQTAGMISNYINGKLSRITGLDPAKPLFIFANANRKLGKDDAEFVDIIHTDILQRGVFTSIGHLDFYVNGGIEQVGCNNQKEQSTGSCNHLRATQYFAESINSPNGFWGFRCNQWHDWLIGMCKPTSQYDLAIMGMHSTNSTNSSGNYFVYTNKEPPYAKGIQSSLKKYLQLENNFLR